MLGQTRCMGPAEELAELVAELNATDEPDFAVISEISVGRLENLIRAHGEELWPSIELLARSDRRFRRALTFVWAYDSAEFDRREALLEELGEFWTETVSFIASRDGFDGQGEVSWRAFDRKGQLSPSELAAVLRRLADWLEQPK